MKKNLMRLCALSLLIATMSFSTTATAQGKAENIRKAAGPSILGTWKLVSRKLPDGTTIAPPMCIGLQTFTATMRNFNIGWVDNTGKHFSYSVISNYTLTDKDYTEEVLYSCMNDEMGIMNGAPGKGPVYVMKSESKTVPVTVEGKKFSFQMPFDPPNVVVNGNTMTATAEGRFTDTWERIR